MQPQPPPKPQPVDPVAAKKLAREIIRKIMRDSKPSKPVDGLTR